MYGRDSGVDLDLWARRLRRQPARWMRSGIPHHERDLVAFDRARGRDGQPSQPDASGDDPGLYGLRSPAALERLVLRLEYPDFERRWCRLDSVEKSQFRLLRIRTIHAQGPRGQRYVLQARHMCRFPGVNEYGWIWDLCAGRDAGPYFDNVSLKVFSIDGPRITTRELEQAQDNFPPPAPSITRTSATTASASMQPTTSWEAWRRRSNPAIP